MASVWRARDLTLERPVAVKLLFARDERDKQRLVQQFVREARIAASVHHRNVIHIVDFGTTEEQQPFMVMELLEGESLGQRMHRKPGLAIGEVVHIASLTLRGLQAVHDAGIIHRDLKPDNVYLTRDRRAGLFPKILDFGISRSIEPRSGRRSALTTRDGMIVGTPEYMSPEQARGVRNIDKRTDIYSMGCILYEALAGALPFACENVGDLIIQIVTGTAPPVHEVNPVVPRVISDVVARAMARAAADRFQDALEMQQALLAAAEQALDEKPSAPLSDNPPAPELLVLSPRVSQDRLRTLELTPETPIAAPSMAAGARSADSRAAVEQPGALPIPAAEDVLAPQRSYRARKPLLAALALSALVAAGVLAWQGQRAETGSLRMTAGGQAAQSPRPAAVPAAPLAERPTLDVQLRNIPAGALVSVDGMPASGTPLELPRDGRNRVIRVTAPGKTPWQVVHHASADASYEVWLVDSESAPAARVSKSSTISRVPTAHRTRPKKKPPSALRNLDF